MNARQHLLGLNEWVESGTLLRETTRAGRERTARFTLLPGCDTDDLTRIAETHNDDREALLLRAALLMHATSVDAGLLANLDAFMLLCQKRERGVPCDGDRQALIVHLRALCSLARRDPHMHEEQVSELERCCDIQQRRWELSKRLISEQVGQRITTINLMSCPPSTILTSGALLEKVFTRWVDDGTLQILVTDDGPVPQQVRRFVLGTGAAENDVAAVATLFRSKRQFHLELLWWVARAMNANRADKAFIKVIKTALVLAECIELPPVSTWDELSRLCAHATALQLLKLRDPALHLQECIEQLRASVTWVEHEFFSQVLACADAIVQRLPADGRKSGGLRRLEKIEAQASHARAEHGLKACGLGDHERAACLAKPEALEVVMRLRLQGNLRPRVESSTRDGCRGFDALRRAEPGDVVTLASVFAGVGRPALALQLLAAHLTQLAALTPEDFACVSSAIDIGHHVDPEDSVAVQAIRSILLHIRLLLHCELASVEELEAVDVDAPDDGSLDAQEIEALRAGNEQVTILREFEAALLKLPPSGTAETADALPLGEVDGLCHLLERMAADPLQMVGRRRAALMQAAVEWAATCTGPARDGLLQACGHAEGLPAGAEDLTAPCKERRRALAVQREQQLKDAAFTFQMKRPPGGEWWQRQLIVPPSVQVPVDRCLAYVAAMLRRSGRTPPNRAACWVPLLARHVDARDTPRRARLLVVGLRTIERDPTLMAEVPFFDAMTKFLADPTVLLALQGEMPDDLPSVVFSLVLACSDEKLHALLHDGLKAISRSAAFASAMTRRSGAWMLGGALSCIVDQPLQLLRPEVCEVLRRMATPPARSGSMKAMAMPVVMRLLREHGDVGPALVECLALQGLEARRQRVDGVMTCVETREGASSGMTPRKARITRKERDTLCSLLAQNIAPRRRLLHSNPPGLVTEDPLLHATWLGAGVADVIAGDVDGENLLPMLADVHRAQHRRFGEGWRESGEGLAFALQLFLRAAADQPDEVLDGLVCARGSKGMAMLMSSQGLAFAALVACQVVLKRRPVQLEVSGVSVQLAMLMCAASSLEMRDPVACLRHLREARACQGETIDTDFIARVWARLHAECLRRHPSMAW